MTVNIFLMLIENFLINKKIVHHFNNKLHRDYAIPIEHCAIINN